VHSEIKPGTFFELGMKKNGYRTRLWWRVDLPGGQLSLFSKLLLAASSPTPYYGVPLPKNGQTV
jgi:hypothetical protein